MPDLEPLQGYIRKLVLAFDVGTTYSGISYALLDPGEVPVVREVTRFPGQENAAGESKIPSILYYTASGHVRAVGAEAALLHMTDEAEDGGLIFVEWFKLHLRPTNLSSEQAIKARVPPLPSGKTVEDVFADFLRYLYSCARDYIIETRASGKILWNSLGSRIEFVLSHPNGWGGNQQTKMRRAVVKGGLIPDSSTGHARIHFVSEGEASLYYCINSGLAATSLHEGNCIMIVDAGGGTVDLSTYKFSNLMPLTIEEIVSPDYILRKSQYKQDIRWMLDYFDRNTKPLFKDKSDTCHIKFGSIGCNDPAVQIRHGQMTISGYKVASFFEPAISAIIKAVLRQRAKAPSPLTEVFLVGGSKAVAEGAVSHYLEQWVSVRVAKTTYGTGCMISYNPLDMEHLTRGNTIQITASGDRVFPDAFSVILPKGTRFRSNQEVSRSYCCKSQDDASLNHTSAEITSYRGTRENPKWVDIEPHLFTELCTIYADTSRVKRVWEYGTLGYFYTQNFDIVLICGSTELQAQIRWIEDGEEKRGDATIVYDDDVEALS
ncbi:hypothetical protein WOLCODRAFT_146366 [Wolfiporia cocos MD-104 SS10]|uniref:Actin-like ATPase domain-containing protein n=1 Tax=Wolfiporia cocos (strain MD-104) TaxID=742152 RepID=A0A2H3J3Z2_WOLCO|nr:hypothetical protein WOLCODRAFT_146366 [Wolfiporia cocos MD-104 SS10]